MSLPANWTAGNQFTAANENSVETAVNASTNTLAAATATPTASVLAQFDANKNLSASNVFEGFTTTATAAGTTALLIGSTEIQVFTGTMAQTVTLPTTSVPTGASWTVLNQSTGLVTVQSSGSNTVAILQPGTGGVFYSLVATPTTAANWNYRESGQLEQLGLVSTATAAGTTTLTQFSADTQVFTGTMAQTVLLPTTGVFAGADYTIINNSTGIVTVQSSGANNVALLPGGCSGLFVAAVATPTTAANWVYLEQGELSQLGFTTTATAAGTTTLTVFSTEEQVFTGTMAQTVLLPTTGVPQGAQYFIINQSSGAVTVQSSGANTVLVLPGSAAAPFSAATFTSVVATPTTAANWDFSGQGAGNAVLGTPISGTLTNCTLPWQQLTGGTTIATPVSVGTGTNVVAAYQIPANTAAAGSTYGFNAFGVNTGTSGTVGWYVYTGSTASATTSLVASANTPIALSSGSTVTGQFAVRTTGAGSCMAALSVTGGSAAGSTAVSVQTSTVALTTTANSWITLCAGVSGGSHAVQTVFISPGG